MWMLDTNSLIYFFKGMGRVSSQILQHEPGEIGIPTIVLYELQVGIANSTSPIKRIRQLNDFSSQAILCPFGAREAKFAADIRVDLEKTGRTIGSYDLLIAGTALANNAILVSHNTKEFGRIKNLNLIDWY